MRLCNWIFLIVVLGTLNSVAADTKCGPALDFHKRPLLGEEPVHLCEVFAGKVVLIVNTASKCAFTPQYGGLEALYQKYGDQGLVVAGFPSNDFAGQEPGTEKQIQDFCRLTYGVQFPMFEKIRVKGKQADPLYQYLVAATGKRPRWNFYKYLVDREGNAVAAFSSMVKPNDARLIEAVEALL
jgi:glutathione peroxidase